MKKEAKKKKKSLQVGFFMFGFFGLSFLVPALLLMFLTYNKRYKPAFLRTKFHFKFFGNIRNRPFVDMQIRIRPFEDPRIKKLMILILRMKTVPFCCNK